MVRHNVILRGYGAAPNDLDAPPLLVKRTEDEFIPALLEDLRGRTPSTDLAATGPDDLRADGRRQLLLPIHRAFNLLVIEAVCDAPGHPRIHPLDIAGSGFVVRQVANEAQPETDLGWQHRNEQPLGWLPLSDPKADPDPAQRRPRFRTGHPEINAEIARRYAGLEQPGERIAPLFVAPPEVCAAAGRTLLYGLVPVTSSEEQTLDPASLVTIDDVRTLLPEFLRAGTGNYQPVADGQTLNLPLVEESETAGYPGTLGLFLLGLRSLNSVWRVFAANDADAAAFRALLNRLTLRWANGYTRRLGDHLAILVQNLLVERNAGTGFLSPVEWPFPDTGLVTDLENEAIKLIEGGYMSPADTGLVTDLENEALRLLQARHAKRPSRIKRFDDPAALYRIHAFVRVWRTENCPPVLYWSKPGQPYAVAPWWENGGNVHTISLPDLDAAGLSKLKPNVAFALPPALANLLNRNSPAQLMKGAGGASPNPAIAWICSFNIPVITICAFIVLNIFLSLFDLIFHWLIGIKICLPIPTKK